MFILKNRTLTFLSVKLASKDVVLPAEGSSDPFPDSEWSEDAQAKEHKGLLVKIQADGSSPAPAIGKATVSKEPTNAGL